MAHRAWMLLTLTGCIETGLNQPTDEASGPPDTATPDTAPPEDTAPDCDVTPAPAVAVDALKVCEAPDLLVEDAWRMEEEWLWTGVAEDPAVDQVLLMPAIGNLTDDNGDGHVTEADVPDVLVVAWDDNDWRMEYPRLVLLDGATGEEHWSLRGFYPLSGVAMVDVTGDGEAEAIAVTTGGAVSAVSGEGEVLWTSEPFLAATYDPKSSYYLIPIITAADLDGDGYAEIVAYDHIIDGATGAVEVTLSHDGSTPFMMASIGDIDLDGSQEIVLGSHVYSPSGAIEWSSTLAGDYGHWSAILNADDDDFAEVAMIAEGMLEVYEHDGTVRVSVDAGGPNIGAPCVADFDGDGAAEIGWASNNSSVSGNPFSNFVVYNLDGTLLWSRGVSDTTGMLAGCSGYDFDGDGAYEILYADSERMLVLDGSDGTTLLSREEHASTTIWEYPVVADVDGDFSAEIVFVSNTLSANSGDDDIPGVVMLGHPEDAWLASGPTWHVHDFAVTNINADGTLPAAPRYWLEDNVFRARPAINSDIGIDLIAEITDVCFSGCGEDDVMKVAVQVTNQGLYPVGDGVPVSVFANDGGSLTLLGIQNTAEAIEPGMSAAGMVIELGADGLGIDGLTVRIDELGAGIGIVDECDESNNAATWEGECKGWQQE
jgi:hypothetical protein